MGINADKLIEELLEQEKKTLDLIAEEIKKFDSCIDAIPQSYFKECRLYGHLYRLEESIMKRINDFVMEDFLKEQKMLVTLWYNTFQVENKKIPVKEELLEVVIDQMDNVL